MATRRRKRSCKNGKLKTPVKTKSGSKRRCKKVSRKRKKSCKNGKLKTPVKTKSGSKRRCKKSRRKFNMQGAAVASDNLNISTKFDGRYRCQSGLETANGTTKYGTNQDDLSKKILEILMRNGGNKKDSNGEYQILCKENLLPITSGDLAIFVEEVEQGRSHFLTKKELESALPQDYVNTSVNNYKKELIQLIWDRIAERRTANTTGRRGRKRRGRRRGRGADPFAQVPAQWNVPAAAPAPAPARMSGMKRKTTEDYDDPISNKKNKIFHENIFNYDMGIISTDFENMTLK